MVHLAVMSGDNVPSFSLMPILYKRLSILGTTLRARPPAYQTELMRRFKEEALPDIKAGDVSPEEGGLRTYIYEVSSAAVTPDLSSDLADFLIAASTFLGLRFRELIGRSKKTRLVGR